MFAILPQTARTGAFGGNIRIEVAGEASSAGLQSDFRGFEVSAERIGKMAFPGVAFPREAQLAPFRAEAKNWAGAVQTQAVWLICSAGIRVQNGNPE